VLTGEVMSCGSLGSPNPSNQRDRSSSRNPCSSNQQGAKEERSAKGDQGERRGTKEKRPIVPENSSTYSDQVAAASTARFRDLFSQLIANRNEPAISLLGVLKEQLCLEIPLIQRPWRSTGRRSCGVADTTSAGGEHVWSLANGYIYAQRIRYSTWKLNTQKRKKQDTLASAAQPAAFRKMHHPASSIVEPIALRCHRPQQ
jgi:hypothetical protein